jgi:hypothetical protein
MGFFGFLKKAAGAVFSVAKVAAPLALGGPLGALASKAGGSILGSLLHSKSPMSSGPLKLNVLGKFSVPIVRGQSPAHALPGGILTARDRRASPVMPGGGIATSAGIMAPGGGLPPATFGASKGSGGGLRRKRRSSSSRRSSRLRSGAKRRRGGRRLKFGSPAWRKKYMKRRGR